MAEFKLIQYRTRSPGRPLTIGIGAQGEKPLASGKHRYVTGKVASVVALERGRERR